jgi:large subunit ribosomal protein L25
MAKFNFELEIEPRETLGKGASRRLRLHDDKVLGIIYGADEKPLPIQMAHHHVAKALENDAVYSHILTLSLNGKKQKVVLKDVQRHPYKIRRVLHMDFMRIDENKPITMHVPVHFLGEAEAPGVASGGTITHYMVEVSIKCLPRDLPEHLDVDLTNAELDTVVHLSGLKLPKGVELLSVIHGPEDDLPVVAIHLPKRLAEEEEATGAPAASEVPATNVKKVEPKAEAGKDKGKGKK